MTGRMLVKLLLLLMLSEVLLFSVSEAKPWWGGSRRRRRRRHRASPPPCDSSSPSGIKWYNDWHQTFKFSCPPGRSLSQWKSIHRNCKEDRIHYFNCASGFCLGSSCRCAWSGHYEHDFDQPLRFTCPHNGVITGVTSEYSGTHRDRRFGFRCCHRDGYKAHTCLSTRYENVWDGDLDYTVEHDRYLVGVNSYHVDYYQDRRWSFHYCQVSKD
ncbi:hemagglutinin/amebocyte aggregation factor-like [Orbicella faveolata]|uniref:hemagglutinin/amebocyte aggregation factor-like n=1 Tax=Orbicella faveolata TaxID=48498 RepID=UPI0009E621FC|nr:hemagglutinin/amebocyte aggregation factor-like [Orbicella faveolata]